MIITDRVHLVSTNSPYELHAFAQCIGLKFSWFQHENHNEKHPHYDLTTQTMVKRAFAKGAMEVTSYELMRLAWWAMPP